MTIVTNIASGYFNMKSNEQHYDKDRRRHRKGMRLMGGGYSYIDTSNSDDEASVKNGNNNASESPRRRFVGASKSPPLRSAD